MAIAIALILIIVGSVIFHFLSPWYFTPLASNWDQMDNTLTVTFVVTGVVFVAINAFMVYAIIRFRHREGQRAAYEPENKKLEWWLTGLTSVGIAIMLAPGLLVYAEFLNVPKDAAVIEVVGKQWQWSYRFPGADGVLGSVDPKLISFANPFGLKPDDPSGQDDILVQSGDLHIPVNKPVQVMLRSKDVLHDFYVPHFRVKMDAVPGVLSSFWFTPIKVGRFDIACAEYCGIGHYAMRGFVVVDEEETFQAWLDTQPTYAQLASAATSSGLGNDRAEQGRQLAQEQGCLGCHSVDGSAGVGPTWKNLFGKNETLVGGRTVVADAAYLKQSIVNPSADVVDGYASNMPSYDLDGQQWDPLVAFMMALASPDTGTSSSDTLVERGQQVAEAQGCFGCHSVDGSAGAGPTWKGLWGKRETLNDGTDIEVDGPYLKESIVDPKVKLVQGYAPIMPPYDLSENELAALIAYTKSLATIGQPKAKDSN